MIFEFIALEPNQNVTLLHARAVRDDVLDGEVAPGFRDELDRFHLLRFHDRIHGCFAFQRPLFDGVSRRSIRFLFGGWLGGKHQRR